MKLIYEVLRNPEGAEKISKALTEAGYKVSLERDGADMVIETYYDSWFNMHEALNIMEKVNR